MSLTPPVKDAEMDASQDAAPKVPHHPLRRVNVLVNPASGSVGSRAIPDLTAILAEYEIEAEIVSLADGDFATQIDRAFEGDPDAIFVLAGDGTAGTVADRAGAQGPLIATLPGGTMNMLPRALYGTADWKAALRLALEEGEPIPIAGGKIEGKSFFCAAILGSPALWAPAREAIRAGKIKRAWQYSRRAWRRAFSGRLRYALDGSPRRKTEALMLISPMISAAMEEPVGLEAAAMDPNDTGQAFRLAVTALFSDWRRDESVRTQPARRIECWGRSKIPAVVDGEPLLVGHETRIDFVPRAFMALAPRPPAKEDSV